MPTNKAQSSARSKTVSLDPLVTLLADDMRAVNTMIMKRLSSDVPLIPELAGHLIAAGGKRIRPMMTLAGAKITLKTDPKKGPKMTIFRTPQCGASVVNSSKIDDFRVLVLGPFGVSFWGRFGGPNGDQKHAQVVPKRVPESCVKNGRFLIDFGVPLGTLLELERGK